MPFDVLLKKYFAGIILAMIAVIAYFQASGTTQLLGGWLGVGEEALTSAPAARVDLSALQKKSQTSSKSAEPILARNPFDSVTGPLNAKPIETELLTPPEQIDVTNPLSAPKCNGVQVNIVTESDDPKWSFAAIKGPGDSEVKLRRVGDQVGEKEVVFIGYNSSEASPAVWLSDQSLCQALLFAEAPAAATPKPTKKPTKSNKKSSGRGAPPLPADIADKIQRVSETEFNVDRSVVDKILENQAQLMRSARIVPEQKDGKVVGIRLFGIRPDTLLGKLGLQNGDRLETINGYNMSSPEKALEAYARLRTADSLSVKVNRRGKPVNIDFKIK